MPSRRIFALLCAAPFMLTSIGCSNRALRVSRVNPPSAAEMSSYSARMMQLAERYEQQGNREGALRLYRQITANEPVHSRAQSRIAAITGHVSQPAVNETGSSVAAAAPDDTPSTREIPVSSVPEPEVAVHPSADAVATPQRAVSTPRDLPATDDATQRAFPPADSDAALAAWAPSSSDRIATPAWATDLEVDEASEGSAWWDESPVLPEESASPASNGTSRAVDGTVAATAAWTRTSLVRLCPDAGDALRLIVGRLDCEDKVERKEALMVLSDLGDEAAAALPAVESLLDDSDGSIRAHAAWALWRIGGSDGRSVSTLAALTQSDTDEVVQVAAFFLGSIGPDAGNVVRGLRQARDQSTGATRLHLAEALIRIDPQDLGSLNELTRALQDPSAEIRWLATVALSGVSSDQASWVIPGLASRLTDSDDSVCSAAALTLGSLGPAATLAVSSLEQARAHHAPDVRMAAEAALACIQR